MTLIQSVRSGYQGMVRDKAKADDSTTHELSLPNLFCVLFLTLLYHFGTLVNAGLTILLTY
jgi:hypothetical protein